ncbi:MAG: acyl--CoA ligase [Deltaproteobacteria bacterium]|nr:acyl--CoA ligase [Deltaproteobacteria bacterium]
MFTIVDLVVKNARMYPEKIAYVQIKPISNERKQVTWLEFYQKMTKIASYLRCRKIGKGKKVALLGRNSIEWLEVFFGIMASGAVVVPLNYRFTNEDIKYCFDIAEPQMFFFDEEYLERIVALRSYLDGVQCFISMGTKKVDGIELLEDIFEKFTVETEKVDLRDEEECALYFTSGTTGAPKAVLHAHRTLMVSALSEAICHEWTSDDVQLMMPPLYHLAIGHLLGGLITGGTNVLLTELIRPDIVIETLSKERCTLVFLLVPWALDIIRAIENGEIRLVEYDLNKLRLIHMGAQPIPTSLIKKLKAYFPHVSYDTTYGLSEAGGPGITHLGKADESKIGSIGKPTLLWDLRIVNEKGEDVKIGEVGEILVKGNGIMKEYYKNPEATFKTIREGWLYTGDLAKMDDEGFIYIVDRKKDLIISGGENIYPAEIEAVLHRHPKIFDVAVIGVPDERLGEAVAAVICPKTGEKLTVEEMKSYCEQNLPRYKRPRHFFFDEIPRNPSGKIEKQKLRAKYGG